MEQDESRSISRNTGNFRPAHGWGDTRRRAGITAVIPAKNEAGRVVKVVHETLTYVDSVLVVDDGSTDRTGEEASAAGAKVVANLFSKGYIGALRTGFHEAEGEILVTLDADGEHDPQDIPSLIEPIMDDKADLVLGCRKNPADIRSSERLLSWLARRRVPHVIDTGTGFRAIRSKLAQKLELKGHCTCGVFVLEAASRGARITEVQIKTRRPVTQKRRQIMWRHFPQAFYVLHWLLKKGS